MPQWNEVQSEGGLHMLALVKGRSRYMLSGCPTHCASCGEPFPVVDNHVEAWRAGESYFCNALCAGAEIEPPAQRKAG